MRISKRCYLHKRSTKPLGLGTFNPIEIKIDGSKVLTITFSINAKKETINIAFGKWAFI